MNCYKRLCTEFYDIDKPAPPQDALDFYVQYAAQARGAILEPMCGSGRFLLPLIERGFDVDGTDASPQMLAACRAKCLAKGFRPVLLEQPLDKLDLPRRYALAIIPSGSFGLIVDPEAATRSLERLRSHLADGAKLVLEIDVYKPTPSGGSPWGGRWVQRPDGAKIMISWLSQHDAASRITRSIHRYELIRDGRLIETEFEDFELRAYDVAEFAAMLRRSGFDDVRTLKTFANHQPDASDDSVVFEATMRR